MTETADIPKSTRKIDPKLANAWKTKAGRDLTEVLGPRARAGVHHEGAWQRVPLRRARHRW